MIDKALQGPVIRCPEAGGLVNDPGHLLNFVDRNCVPYSWLQLGLFAGGCLLWVAAYAILIRNIRRDKFVEMATVAACSNFAWEFLWAFRFFTDMGYFLVLTYRAWFFLDIFIFWLMLKHGGGQVEIPFFKRHFQAACALTTVAFGLMYYFFTQEGHDTFIGANSAYIAQMFISSLCLLMILKAPSVALFSLPIGWLRSVGTGMNTVFMLLHYPSNHFLHTLALTSLVLDGCYLWVFWRRRRESAAVPAFASGPAGRAS